MRYTLEHKDKTYGRILRSASRLIRTRGVSEVSIAKVMADAGMTHGSFYAHFESKSALAATAISNALVESRSGMCEHVNKAKQRGTSPIRAIIDNYLSEKHLEAPWRGCAFSAISQEVGREPSPARDVMRERMRDTVNAVAPDMEGASQAEREAKVEFLYSAMVGIVTISRLANTREERLATMERSKAQLLRLMGVD